MKIVISFLALYLGLVASAVAGSQTGQVVWINVRASDGLIYLLLNGTGTGKPACATATYWIIKDENSATGKRQLALLLSARVTGQSVSISGAGTCTRYPDGEDVDAVSF